MNAPLIKELLRQVHALKADNARLKQQHPFVVMPLQASEVEEAMALLHCAAFTNLVPRPSSENEHTGHSINNPRLFGALGRKLVSEAPRPGLLSLRRRNQRHLIAGVLAYRIEHSTAVIECIAFDDQAFAGTHSADTVLDFILAELFLQIRGTSIHRFTVNAWIDVKIDERGPLAQFKGTPRDLGQQMLAAFQRAGFTPTADVHHQDLEMMMGLSLDHTLAPLPALPEGYSTHFSR